jgi:hypothetical protein
MSVAQGIELGRDDAVNEKQIAVAVQMARDGLVESLIVGNEALSSGTVSKARLIAYLRKVRQLTPREVFVTTAEVWDVWNKNPDLVDATDFVMAHFYPFWEKQHIEDANQSLWRNYETLQRTLRRAYPSREPRIVIGETGWPSGGPALGRAVPNADNQRRFLEEFTASACAKGVPFYFFEAFDEEWKWKEGVARSDPIPPPNRSFTGHWIGASWGLYRSNGKLKTGLSGLLEQPAPGSRLDREILSDGRLAAQYRIGSASVEGKGPRVSRANDAVEIVHPAGQRSGVVYVAVGDSSTSPPAWRDFSEFDAVSFELRGLRGRENVSVSIRTDGASQDGNVPQVWLTDVATNFQTYTIPLSQFASAHLPMPDGLTRLHIVLQFVFSGSQSQTVYVRNIRYLALK